MGLIDETVRQVIKDSETIISEAVAEARKLAGANRGELRRVRDRIVAIDTELTRLAERLTDPDLSQPATKRLLSRQVTQKSEERERLEARQAELAADANNNTDRLADAVRQAVAEMKQSLARVAPSPLCQRRFRTQSHVDRFQQKDKAQPDEAKGVTPDVNGQQRRNDHTG